MYFSEDSAVPVESECVTVDSTEVDQTDESQKHHLLDKLKGFNESRNRSRKCIVSCSFIVSDCTCNS